MICPVCKCHRLHLIPARGRRKELDFDTGATVEVQYYSCKRCGTVQKWPRPSEATLRRYYEKAWQSEVSRPWECLHSAATWIRRALKPHFISKFHSALDVGAKDTLLLEAIGSFVPVLKRLARDPHPVEAESAWLGSGPETTPPESYELVTCTHVLEHVVDIESFLADLGDRVALRGCLYIEVPALEGFDYSTENIHRAHLWHFPLNALAYLATNGVLASLGMQVLALETDLSVSGWPVNRLLLQRTDSLVTPLGGTSALWERQERCQEEAYIQAMRRLDEHKPPGAFLWGACETLLQLAHYGASRGPRLGGYRLVDTYKAGTDFLSWKVEAPEAIEGTALITTRNWTSIESIKTYLKERHPAIKAVALFD